MANVNVLNELSGNGGEAEISVVLDTLMYCDALDKKKYQNSSVDYIVNDLLANGNLTGDRLAAVQNVRTYLDTHENNSVADLCLGSCSGTMSDLEGAYGATFYRAEGNNSNGPHTVTDVYVAFKGTGDGRWYDNGDAFSKENSPYQRQAAEYFDRAINLLENDSNLVFDSSCNVITTGHSKGANISQYVALASKNAYLVDKVISFDGQGFSPEAIEYFKQLYGEDFYREQCDKMYSVSGDNDFVNVLGVKIISEDHTVYIMTDTEEMDVPNAHALYDGNKPNFFNYDGGSFYPPTTERRHFSLIAGELSEYVMTLPAEDREAVCRTVMSLLELGMGGDEANLLRGLNNEVATSAELLETLTHLDDIVEHLLRSESVQDLINQTVDDWLNSHDPFINNKYLPLTVSLLLSVTYRTGVKGLVVVLEGLVYRLSQVISTAAKVAQAFIKVKDFCAGVLNAVKKGLKYLSSDYRAAMRYLKNNHFIKCDTSSLRSLADRICTVNGKLSYLDGEISDLYWKVKWTDLMTLQRADYKIGHSSKLQKCANYLYDTAQRFEEAESKVLELLG